MKSLSTVLLFLTLVSCREAHHFSTGKKCLNSAIQEHSMLYIKDAHTIDDVCETCPDQTVDEMQATADARYGYDDFNVGNENYSYGRLSLQSYNDLSSNALKFVTDQVFNLIFFVYFFG
jgi:hypothetical protein